MTDTEALVYRALDQRAKQLRGTTAGNAEARECEELARWLRQGTAHVTTAGA